MIIIAQSYLANLDDGQSGRRGASDVGYGGIGRSILKNREDYGTPIDRGFEPGKVALYRDPLFLSFILRRLEGETKVG